MSSHRIAVLGPIPSDHILTHRGEEIEKFGCAMHTAIGISRLLGNDGEVIPVAHVQRSDEAAIKAILSKYPNIRQDYIRSDQDAGDEIRLEFLDQNRRLERQTGYMPPITPEDLEGLMDCAAFVCVPITDYEVPLETLKHIRAESDGFILFDAHGPTNTVSVEGKRYHRYWIDRERWFPSIDVLKMNLEESFCTWYEAGISPDVGESTDHLPALAKHALEGGVRALIITLDSKGSAVFVMKDGEVIEKRVSAIWVDHVVDTTGCGDSFAGGLGYGLVEFPDDILQAVKYASALGAQRTQGKTFDVFKSREETDDMIARHYTAE